LYEIFRYIFVTFVNFLFNGLVNTYKWLILNTVVLFITKSIVCSNHPKFNPSTGVLLHLIPMSNTNSLGLLLRVSAGFWRRTRLSEALLTVNRGKEARDPLLELALRVAVELLPGEMICITGFFVRFVLGLAAASAGVSVRVRVDFSDCFAPRSVLIPKRSSFSLSGTFLGGILSTQP
jgi:hypothetical protein